MDSRGPRFGGLKGGAASPAKIAWTSCCLGLGSWISLMTGSAGTAMDVLVTCFSKKGGGSGRRGCKDRAQSVISVHYTGCSENLFFSRFSFSPNVSKTWRLPYF